MEGLKDGLTKVEGIERWIDRWRISRHMVSKALPIHMNNQLAIYFKTSHEGKYEHDCLSRADELGC